MTNSHRSDPNLEFASEVEDARRQMSDLLTNPKSIADWRGPAPRGLDFMLRKQAAFSELIGEVTDTFEGWRILDYGCGEGAWLRMFLEMDAKPSDLLGVDISEGPIKIGRGKNPPIDLRQIDGWQIPCNDESFDLVTQFVCFSSIPNPQLRHAVAREIQRVLKPGGYVYWWDLPRTVAPTERGTPLEPEGFFNWNVRRRWYARKPRPSECIRPSKARRSRIVKAVIGSLVDLLRYRDTHLAALIGPKPGPALPKIPGRARNKSREYVGS